MILGIDHHISEFLWYFKSNIFNFIFDQGSLEEVVENLVKTWECEASHKADMNQWTTIDPEKYKVQVNNGEILDGEKAFEMGNYNAIMKDCPAYQKCK